MDYQTAISLLRVWGTEYEDSITVYVLKDYKHGEWTKEGNGIHVQVMSTRGMFYTCVLKRAMKLAREYECACYCAIDPITGLMTLNMF